MKRAIVALFALAVLPVHAATIQWTHPTTYSDGSALALSDIASTTIEWSNGATFGAVNGSQVVSGSANSAVVPDPAAGSSRCWRARTTVVAAKGGQTSGPSNVSCKTVPFPAPNPPTIIDVILAWLRNFFGRFA